MRSGFIVAFTAAAALLAAPLAASAQGQTDNKSNTMGSEQVGNGMKKSTSSKKHSGTTGANMRAKSSGSGTTGSNQGNPQAGGNKP